MSDDAATTRILGHMNQDHKLNLYDYLSFYKGIKLDINGPTTEVVMTGLTLHSATLQYRENSFTKSKHVEIPIVPPMKDLGESRATLLEMAKLAAEAKGFAANRFDRYVLPAKTSVGSFLVPIFFILCAIHSFDPAALIKLSPALANVIDKHGGKSVAICLGVHFIEYVIFTRPTLNKYRASFNTKALWFVSHMFEGFPTILRLNGAIGDADH